MATRATGVAITAVPASIRIVVVVVPFFVPLLAFPLAQTEGHSPQLLGPIPAFLLNFVLLFPFSPLVGLVLLVEGSLHLPLELLPQRETTRSTSSRRTGTCRC